MDSARLLRLLDSLHAHLRAAQASGQASQQLVDAVEAWETCGVEESREATLAADPAQLTRCLERADPVILQRSHFWPCAAMMHAHHLCPQPCPARPRSTARSKLVRLAAQLCALDAALASSGAGYQLVFDSTAALAACANVACWADLGRNDTYRVATAARLVLNSGAAALRAAVLGQDNTCPADGLDRVQLHAANCCLQLLDAHPEAAAAWAATVAPPGLLVSWLDNVTAALQRRSMAHAPGEPSKGAASRQRRGFHRRRTH